MQIVELSVVGTTNNLCKSLHDEQMTTVLFRAPKVSRTRALRIVTFREHQARRPIESSVNARAALIRGLKGPRRIHLFRFRHRDCYHRQSRYMKLGNSGYGYSSIVVITILRPHCHSVVWCAAIVRLCGIQKGARTRSGATTISKEPNKYEKNRPREEKSFVSHSKLYVILEIRLSLSLV
jgi:hypothetical protein